MNDRVDELYIKMASLYSKQSDVGLCGAEEQELWELEQEYKKFIDLNK